MMISAGVKETLDLIDEQEHTLAHVMVILVRKKRPSSPIRSIKRQGDRGGERGGGRCSSGRSGDTLLSLVSSVPNKWQEVTGDKVRPPGSERPSLHRRCKSLDTEIPRFRQFVTIRGCGFFVHLLHIPILTLQTAIGKQRFAD